MFYRVKQVKGHEYLYLVKSERIDGKVRQQIIEYKGRVSLP